MVHGFNMCTNANTTSMIGVSVCTQATNDQFLEIGMEFGRGIVSARCLRQVCARHVLRCSLT